MRDARLEAMSASVNRLAAKIETLEAENAALHSDLAALDDVSERAADADHAMLLAAKHLARVEALEAENAALRRDLANECERRDDIINCETHLRTEAEARIEALEKALREKLT